MRKSGMRQWHVVFALALVGVMLVSASAHASTINDVTSNVANLGSGGGQGLGNMLGSLIEWMKGRVSQIVILAFLGVGLALAFNKNFLQAAESIAYIGAICCFLAWVMSGAGISNVLGMVVP